MMNEDKMTSEISIESILRQKLAEIRDGAIISIESILRQKLAEIRDGAMELAAQLEFSPIADVTENDVWKWATKVIRESEEIMTNSCGELSL